MWKQGLQLPSEQFTVYFLSPLHENSSLFSVLVWGQTNTKQTWACWVRYPELSAVATHKTCTEFNNTGVSVGSTLPQSRKCWGFKCAIQHNGPETPHKQLRTCRIQRDITRAKLTLPPYLMAASSVSPADSRDKWCSNGFMWASTLPF